MEIESNYNIQKNSEVWYTLDFGTVEVGVKNNAVLYVKGASIKKGRTSCQCTLADVKENKVEINYTGNQSKKINQRVVLTTDLGVEIYIDVTGEVK